MRTLGKRVYGETRIVGSNPTVSVLLASYRKEGVCASRVIKHTYSAAASSSVTPGRDANGKQSVSKTDTA